MFTIAAIASVVRLLDAPKSRESPTSIVSGGLQGGMATQGIVRIKMREKHIPSNARRPVLDRVSEVKEWKRTSLLSKPRVYARHGRKPGVDGRPSVASETRMTLKRGWRSAVLYGSD